LLVSVRRALSKVIEGAIDKIEIAGFSEQLLERRLHGSP